ncbi:MAG: hypothetical protein K9N40_04740 [Candidatus Cloacimonetes bacterium]|nr:hypothetical protein [Candidatus Cloacimonadota bacterium]
MDKFEIICTIIIIVIILSVILVPELNLFKNEYNLQKSFCAENIAQYSVLKSGKVFDLYLAHKGDQRCTDLYLINLDGSHMNQLEIQEFSLYCTTVDDYFKSFYDEEENKIYTLATKNRADYYLLEFDTEDTLINHKFYFLYHDDLYDKLQNKSIEITGINFTGFNTSESLPDSVKVIKENNNCKIIMKKSLFRELLKKSHLNFCNFPLSKRISKLIGTNLKCEFIPENLFELIHFFSRNSYYGNHRLNNSKKMNTGFLIGDILARIDINDDGTKEFLIQISGDRWLPSKLVCFDKKQNKILWERDFCGFIKNFKLIDINHDNKKEIVASTYAPRNQTPIDYFEKDYFNSTLYSSLFILNQNGRLIQSNNEPLIVHSEQGYYFHKFIKLPNKKEIIFGLSSKHDNSTKNLELWNLEKNEISELAIDYNNLLSIDIEKKDIIIIDRIKDAIERKRYSSNYKLVDKKIYNTESQQDFEYHLGEIDGTKVSLSSYPNILLDDSLKKLVEIDEFMHQPKIINNKLFFIRKDDHLSTLMKIEGSF